MIERLCRSPMISFARENGEMRRHRVLRNLDKPRQFASRDALGLARDEPSESFEPCRLGESRQRGYDFRIIHASNISDLRMYARLPTRLD